MCIILQRGVVRTHRISWNALLVGDFDNDGLDDLAGHDDDDDTWWVGLSTGTSLTSSIWQSCPETP